MSGAAQQRMDEVKEEREIVGKGVDGKEMRLICTNFFVLTLGLIGTLWSQGQTDEQFVTLEFENQHVFVFVLGESDLSNFRTKGASAEIVKDRSKRALKISG